MNTKQKIKIQCIKSGNISLNEVARRCNWASSNFAAKINNDSWRIEELQQVAKALNCTLYTAFEYKGEIVESSDMSELIRIQCVIAEDVTLTTLAERCGWSKAALNNRLSKNKWRVSDMELIASALNSKFILEFRPIS